MREHHSLCKGKALIKRIVGCVFGMTLATVATTSYAWAQSSVSQPTAAPVVPSNLWANQFDDGKLHLTITPTLYFPGGNATLDNNPANQPVGFPGNAGTPVLFAFATGLRITPAGTVEARKGKFSAFLDASSASMALSSTRYVALPALTGTYAVNQQMATTENAFTAALGYTLYRNAVSNVDVFGGARLIGVVDYLNDQFFYPGVPNNTSSVSENNLRIDGVAGVRGRLGIAGGWYLPYYADLGAGGAGFSWQENSGVGYDFGKAGALSVTDRNLYLNRNGNANVLNGLNFGGPALNYDIRLDL